MLFWWWRVLEEDTLKRELRGFQGMRAFQMGWTQSSLGMS